MHLSFFFFCFFIDFDLFMAVHLLNYSILKEWRKVLLLRIEEMNNENDVRVITLTASVD